MIEDRRYCPEILVQTRAIAAALKAVELDVLERHIRHCVAEALMAKKSDQSEEKLKELISLLGRF